MDEIFQSECNADTRMRAAERRGRETFTSKRGATASLCRWMLVKEDAEALALAILGLPDRPVRGVVMAAAIEGALMAEAMAG